MFILLVLVVIGSLPYRISSGSISGPTGAQVLNCDGSFAITRLCNEFCKSIQAYEGYCNLHQNTCMCTGNPLGLPISAVPATVTINESETGSGIYTREPARSAIIAPAPASGLHEIPAPDLSQLKPSEASEQNVTLSGLSSTRRKRNIRNRIHSLLPLIWIRSFRNRKNLITHKPRKSNFNRITMDYSDF